MIILLTSNIGAKAASSVGKTIGFGAKEEDDIHKANTVLDKEFKKRFAPEFLNRLDGIIHFNALTEDNIKVIIRLELDKSVKRFKDIGYEVTYDDNVIEHIFEVIKDESEYGARPIIRAVQNEIEDPLTDAILDGVCNNKLHVEYNENNIVIECDEKED